jgi:hypothetical protein
MQAITTKYLPVTNFKPSRIKAKCERGSIIVSFDHGLNIAENHKAAADALVNKFVKEDKKRYGTDKNPWSKKRAMGSFFNGEYAHVFIE